MAQDWENQANWQNMAVNEDDSVAKYMEILQQALAKVDLAIGAINQAKELVLPQKNEEASMNTTCSPLHTPNRSTNNRKMYECDICKSRFAKDKTYKEHLLKHSAVKCPYACEYCSKAFVQKSHLLRHIQAEHHKN